MEPSEIWGRIIEALEGAKMSTKQVDIAKLCGVKPPSVTEWKRRYIPDFKHIITIAMATGVTVDWLYTGRGRKKPEPPAGSDTAKLIGMLDDLPNGELAEVLKFAEYKKDIAGKS